MYEKSEAVKQARRELIQQAFNEICDVPSYSSLYMRAFYVIAKFGLQLKAKEERLFETEGWDEPQYRVELLRKLKDFLNRYIR